MKKLILILLLFAAPLFGQGFGKGWGPMDQTGAGLSTLDSLYVIGQSRFGGVAYFTTNVGARFGTVVVKDTLTGRLRTLSAMFDTVAVGTGLMYQGAGRFQFSTGADFNGTIYPSAVEAAGYVLALNGQLRSASTTADISKNNMILVQAVATNPYIVFSDSVASGARTRDSIVYSTNSFTLTDTAKMTVITIGSGTAVAGIYHGNATGWTVQNTIDTNLVSGATVASRISLTFRAATATLTAPICGRTVVDTLFISCAAADTSAVRQGSVDYLIFK